MAITSAPMAHRQSTELGKKAPDIGICSVVPIHLGIWLKQNDPRL